MRNKKSVQERSMKLMKIFHLKNSSVKRIIFVFTVLCILMINSQIVSAGSNCDKNNNDKTKPNKKMWTLVWSDEFNSNKGKNLDTNGLDLSKWGYQNGTGAEYGIDGWGNNEQQYYSKDNVVV
jgi:hypothetical protein